MDSIRTFIAIELDEALKQELGRLEGRLQDRVSTGVKWVEPGSIHLTLKFLGSTPSSKIAEIETRLEEVALWFTPFWLRLGRVGGFPNLKRPRVIWVGLEGDIETLHKLQLEVCRAIEDLGFPPEERSFTAHLTLGRVKDVLSEEERSRLREAMLTAESLPGGAFEVNSVSLMRSDLTPRGALYTCLREVFLGVRDD